MLTADISGGVLDGNSAFDIHLGNTERIIKPILITNDQGYVVEIQECNWRQKRGYTIPPDLDPNELRIVVRGHPHPIGASGYPHSLVPAYTDLTDVTFQIVAIVH